MGSPVLSSIADLRLARRQCRSLSSTGHRPWPLPERPWVMGQSWLDLLFVHWRVDAEALRRVVPPQLRIDTIDGSAWIGITPFEVRALRARFTPPLPLISAFPELNMRTYVTVDGKPGIFFLSLDAGSRLAVISARRAYRFPYFHARMRIVRDGTGVDYRSERAEDARAQARFAARYEPHGPHFNAAPGSLEWELIERYCAYALDDRGAVLRAEIHHGPWSLQAAGARLAANTMAAPHGIALRGDPLLHFARRQDVVIWPHERA